MRDIRFLLKTHYTNSHALIIGINRYANASPLGYAVSDAEAMRDLLISEFAFPAENVHFLADEAATKVAIQQAFFRFTKDDVNLDDRVLVFFAGHGHTRTGSRGEVGFLVPHDADMSDYSTFIRWDDLTRNAELIRSKHILFIMDACYGGLAVSRHTLPGSTRFLKDMMLRTSRQVLTAGKADEVVSDAGGPLPNHSVFTGHLIEALQGKAATEGDVITAAGVMSYVYGKVANDRNSNQTPHYGHIDGDGDFIFKAPGLSELEATESKDLDRLISVPYPEELRDPQSQRSKVTRIKSLLSRDSNEIELHDFLVEEVRRFLAGTTEDAFASSGQFSQNEFLDRMARYEEAADDLAVLLGCVAYWAKPSHLPSLQKCISRSCDRLEVVGGLQVWIELRWYPLLLQLYCTGISAVDAQRYDTLAAAFYAPLPVVANPNAGFAIDAAGEHLLALIRTDVFKQLPGHEKNYVPFSEYLFKRLQPKLDELLFLGKNYERAFDRFEMLFALAIADLRTQRGEGVWGPIGRFGWKGRHFGQPPLTVLLKEAEGHGDAWPPLRAGMFGGSYARFEEVATEYAKGVSRLPWH